MERNPITRDHEPVLAARTAHASALLAEQMRRQQVPGTTSRTVNGNGVAHMEQVNGCPHGVLQWKPDSAAKRWRLRELAGKRKLERLAIVVQKHALERRMFGPHQQRIHRHHLVSGELGLGQ